MRCTLDLHLHTDFLRNPIKTCQPDRVSSSEFLKAESVNTDGQVAFSLSNVAFHLDEDTAILRTRLCHDAFLLLKGIGEIVFDGGLRVLTISPAPLERGRDGGAEGRQAGRASNLRPAESARPRMDQQIGHISIDL